jgi:hypothetical protein
MNLSAFIVLIGLICVAYWFIMKLYKVKKEEVDEKLTEVKEIEEMEEKIHDVDVDQVLKKKSKIDRLTKL